MAMATYVANAGLCDAAFGAALVSLAIAALGAVCGVWGVLVGVFGKRTRGGVAMGLGSMAMAGAVVYGWWFTSFNGEGAWEHALRYLPVHVVLIGPSLVGGAAAGGIGQLRWRRVWRTPGSLDG